MLKTIWGKLYGPYGVCLFRYASLAICLLQYTSMLFMEFNLSLRGVGTYEMRGTWGLYFVGVVTRQPHGTLWNSYFVGIRTLHIT